MRLGQHFLRDPGMARRIAHALALQPEDLLVEIGPGRGVMTRLLAGRCRKLVGIEVDPALAARLESEFHNQPGVEVLQQDILHTDLAELCRRQAARDCYVFGNLPYYITSPILERVLDARRSVRHASFVVQQEVGERLAAVPETRAYGYLSVFVQCFTRPKIKFEIPSGAFSPPPKVRSALVDLLVSPRFPDWDDIAASQFLRFAQISFAHKRKSLLNNLAPYFSRARVEGALEELALSPRVRAEQISIEEMADLFRRLGFSHEGAPATGSAGVPSGGIRR
ncbi:MAG: 16S rRNA (adenine(1518)-N(6)/adenine(1519)-N(6))-dimethyltransferase RsmA [Terriglobia bacterium]